jgi:hypothetical protein
MRYILHINSGGAAPNRYSWEIHRAGEPFAFRKSAEAYRTAILAKIAGNVAIARLRKVS